MKTLYEDGQIAVGLDEKTRMLTVIHNGLILTQVNEGGLTIRSTQDSSGSEEILIQGVPLGSKSLRPTISINKGDLRWNEVNLIPK